MAKISTVVRGQARWMSTRTAVRETLYDARRPMTVEELTEATGGKATTIRSHLADLVLEARVLEIDGRPRSYVHWRWARWAHEESVK